MTNKRLGNKGFSLLELLVGITMLAIIVVPVMHAFLTSSSTSGKAKEIRNQTVAAQNVLEAYEATDISTILSDNLYTLGSTAAISKLEQLLIDQYGLKSYAAVTDFARADKDGPGYKIYLTGIGVSDKTYDAVLSIDATVEKYNNLNSAGIVDYKPMDAVCIQSDPEKDPDNNPDVIAAKEFASMARIDSGCVMINNGIANNETGVNIDDDYFQSRMTRKIAVTIDKFGGETGVISCTAIFHYETDFVYSIIDETKTPPVTAYSNHYETESSINFYNGAYTAGDYGIDGLYFFFYPNTNSSAGTDMIDILNRYNIPMSIYLIRQSADGSHIPVINLREASSTVQDTQMYYNEDQYQVTYKFYVGYPNPNDPDGFTDIVHRTGNFDGNLIGTPAQNRLYGVTVNLYKANSGFAGAPLAVFDASSLE